MSAPWLIAAVCLVAYVVATFVFLRIQERRASDSEARCGRCGYRTQGLPTTICPECGSDLRIVGLRLPTWWNRHSPPVRRTLLVGAWTLGTGWAAVLAWTPFREYVQPSVRIVYDSVGADSLAGPYQFGVSRAWEVRTWAWERRTTSAPGPDSPADRLNIFVHEKPRYLSRPRLLFGGRDRQTAFRIDLRDLRYEWRIPHFVDSPQNRVLDNANTKAGTGQGADWRAALDAWLRAVGKKRGYAPLRAEVTAVLDTALDAPHRVFPNSLSASFGPTSVGGWQTWRWDNTYVAVFGASALVVWLIGLRLIRSRTNALQRSRAAAARGGAVRDV